MTIRIRMPLHQASMVCHSTLCATFNPHSNLKPRTEIFDNSLLPVWLRVYIFPNLFTLPAASNR
ncbi:MAG: hypothetical protein ABI047_17020 [Jatrophihabitantaceae bacterium]